MATYGSHLVVVAPGVMWPSGDYVDLAVLKIEGATLSHRLGVPLLVGDQAGLGPWEAIGARLPSGDLIELISYAHEPLRGFTLRADAGNASSRVITEALTGLGLNDAALLWINPLVRGRD